MTSAQQQRAFEQAASKGERSLLRDLGSWTTTVVSDWSPGTADVSQLAQEQLDVILQTNYRKISRDILGFDLSLYRQEATEEQIADQVFAGLAVAIAAEIADRATLASSAIITTTREFMRRATVSATQATETLREYRRVARTDLSRRLRRHRLIIAVTEANTMTGIAHRTAVISVTDPLRNTVDQIVALLQAGRFNEARRLSTEAMRLARLPLSLRQGQLIDTISDARDRLVTPLSQGRIVQQLLRRRDELGTETKIWNTMEDEKVRPSHAAANGQRRPIGEPFQLAGGLLQQPRDSSLGASLGEVINCRCIASYE